MDDFISDFGIQLSEFATIKKSDTSGNGIYLDVAGLVRSGSSRDDLHYEILRVPQRAKFSVVTCSELVQELSEPSRTTIIGFIQKVVSDGEIVLSETLVLAVYLVFFIALSASEPQVLGRFQAYFKLLQDTEITTPTLEYADDPETIAKLYELAPYDLWERPDMDLALVEELNSHLGEKKLNPISLRGFIHLKTVIRSRVLEIPRMLAESDEEEYTVDTSLVPVLDFVNHDNSLKNAWFDVDRATDDVILIYEHSGELQDPEAQVFISYTPYEDLKKFAFLYGFVPETGGILKSLEICVDRDYLWQHHRKVYLFGKYFQNLPNLQLLVNAQDSMVSFQKLNMFQSFTFLAFLDGLELSDTGIDAAQEEQEQDLSQDFIAPQYTGCPRFQYRGQAITDAPQLMDSLDNDQIEQVMRSYLKFVKEYFAYKLPDLKKLPPSGTLTYKLYFCQIQAMDSFLHKFDSIDDIFEMTEFAEEFIDNRVPHVPRHASR